MAALAKTLGEVLRASLGAFGAVLVGLQLAVRAGISDAFQAGCGRDFENGRANPPHMVSTNALGLCGFFGRVAVAF